MEVKIRLFKTSGIHWGERQNPQTQCGPKAKMPCWRSDSSRSAPHSIYWQLSEPIRANIERTMLGKWFRWERYAARVGKKYACLFKIVHDYADGVRLCLWTAATNGSTVHPLDEVWAWRAKVETEISSWQVVRLQVMMMRAFWDIAPCNLIRVDRRFGGAYCLYHQP
jgi:hypothetical protein